MSGMFNPELLIVGREARGLSQGDFAELLNVAQGTVSKMESGILKPSDETIVELAHRCDVTPEFFFQSDRVYGFNSTVFFHRKRQSATDRILKKLHARMNILRMRIQRLLSSAKIQAPHRFQSLNVEEYRGRVDVVAQFIRSSWLLPPGPIRSIVKTIEDAGAIVFRMPFETNTIDAISEWIPGHPPILFLNADVKIPTSRLRMTIAHELGHLVMHQLSLSPKIEDEANWFGGEFLMPRKQIKASLYRLNMAKLVDLKQEWKVSMAALVYHAHRLETISPTQYKYLNINLRKRWGIHEPLEEEMPEEKPSLLREVVDAHLTELRYTMLELSRMLFYANLSGFEGELLNLQKIQLVE